MKTARLVTSLVGLALTTACSSGAGVDGAISSVQATASCKTEVPINTDDLAIEGSSTGQAGAPVQYEINQDLTCAGSQKVAWKKAGSNETLQVGAKLVSNFEKAGSYVVTAQVQSSGSLEPSEVSFKTVVVEDEMIIAAPQVTMAQTLVPFELAVPAGTTVASVQWNFADNSPLISSTARVDHVYEEEGNFAVTAIVRDTAGNQKTLTHRIEVLQFQDNLACINELALSVPHEATVGAAVNMSVHLPACLASQVTSVKWNFGDNSALGTSQTVSHTYGAIGSYNLVVQLFRYNQPTAWLTLNDSINVIAAPPVPTPTPVPTPPPVISECSQGQVREMNGELYSEQKSCGLDGSQTLTYRDRIRQECQLVGETLKWVEVSKNKDLQSEGACEGQSCTLPNGGKLTNGQSTTLVTGEINKPLICAFGETGYKDVYQQLTDMTCSNGALNSGSSREGNQISKGACPTYSWVASDTWSACSADCGGEQSRLYSCRNDKGEDSPQERCVSNAPVEKRVCDGNPNAVRRSETSTVIEEAGATGMCPKNQIGVIIQKREVVTTKNYACIDHSVKLESESVVPGAWVEEKYCRDYVAKRCSQDSLSNTEANARYKWMIKCQDKLPVIKEFLSKFDDVNSSSGMQLNQNGRTLYATFMDRAMNPEKPWIAPKKDSAACEMPNSAYVAAVCVSSCATPDQELLAEAEANSKLKYTSFLDALTKDYKFVGTLQSQSINSKYVQKTRVDQWVTEMMDTEHDIIEFRMKSGGSLRLTPNHPLVAVDGSLKEAVDFRVGDSLVQLGGKADSIVSIKHVKYFGKVYNVFVKSAELHKNIVVTNGYLNGTAYFQNEGAKNMNRQVLRGKLVKGVLAK